MTHHDPLLSMRQMLDHAREAWEMAKGKSRRDLDTDRLLNLSVVRLMEVVGEAARRLPTAYRQRYKEIPWQEVMSMRNRLIHGYDAIDFDILWEIVTHDLPPLIEQLDAAIREEQGRNG